MEQVFLLVTVQFIRPDAFTIICLLAMKKKQLFSRYMALVGPNSLASSTSTSYDILLLTPCINWLQGASFSLDWHVYISYTVRHGKTTMVFYVYQAEGSASIYSNKASWAWHPTQVHRDCKSIYTVIVSFAKQWNLSSSSLPCGRVRYPHVSASLQEVV